MRKVIFIIAFFSIILLLYYLIKKFKKKEQPKPSFEFGDVEQFQVDENGNILVFENGAWVIQN